MSLAEEDDSRPWTEHDLKEAIRRINAGEINLKDAYNYYGISPRTIQRQRANENIRVQLNPQKAKKMKSGTQSNTRKDITLLRKPVEISCTSIGDIVSLLNEGTEEVKQLLNNECDLIYECKVCKNLFRSLLNFVSHKRIYCCDMYSVIHTQNDENEDGSVANDPAKFEEKLRAKENFKEFASRPFRMTCRKDLTSILKRITSLTELVPAEPILHLQSMENTPHAFQQSLLPNAPSKESKETPPDSNVSNEKASAPSQAESKKENSLKTTEKTPVVAKPVTHVTEKHFKCPLCPSHCTTKKSVLRHLKSVHHKSEEQLDRLKSRINLLCGKKSALVTKKMALAKQTTKVTSPSLPNSVKATSPPSTSSNENAIASASNIKTDQNTDKGDWERECSFCSRHFVNRNTYASHMRHCRKNNGNDDVDSESTASTNSLVPIVSLPIVALGSVKDGNDSQQSKKLPATSNSKKVGLPVSGSSSGSSKKISIQVRMDYCKEGISQTNSINNASVAQASSSAMTEQCSADTSRRNSAASYTQDEKPNVSRMDFMNGHNTRSNSKLAHKLKTLMDKKGVQDENEEISEKKNDDKDVSATKTIEQREVSILCEDCKRTYALNDFQKKSSNGIARNYKCTLENCDFMSNDKGKLLPHLSAQHAVLSENELAKVGSIFIAESCAVSTDSGKCSCEKTKEECEIKVEKSSANITTDVTQPVSYKRKLNTEAGKLSKSKGGVAAKKRCIAVTDGKKSEKNGNIATRMDANENVEKQNENIECKATVDSSRKTKTNASKKDLSKPHVKKRKPVLVDTTLPSIIIPNGVENTLPEMDVERPFSAMKTAKKQNLTSSETKKSSKMNTLTNFSPLSVAPDVDLDPATMSEENLKKSVMTIIFGKDLSDENIKDEIIDECDNSSASSSVSSENNRDKRYSFRMGKSVVSGAKKGVSSVLDERDDKIFKVQVLNKVKTVPR